MKQRSGIDVSGRKDGLRTSIPFKKTDQRMLPELVFTRSGAEWEVPDETSMKLDRAPKDFHKQREELKQQLEKLGILGDSIETGKQTVGGRSLLHNWQHSAIIQNDDEDDDDDFKVDGAFDVQNYEEEVSADVLGWLDAVRDGTGSLEEAAIVRHERYAKQPYMRAKSSSCRVSHASSTMNGLLDQNAQIPSPLVLNLRDQGSYRKSQSRSQFTLEESYEDDEQEYADIDETESDFTTTQSVESFRGDPRSHPSFIPVRARQPSSSKKHFSFANSRHGHVHPETGFLNESKGGFRAEPWGPEFLEYEVDRMELPGKESERVNHRIRNITSQKSIWAGQEKDLPPDPRKVPKSISGSVMKEQMMLLKQQRFGSAPYHYKCVVSEALPSLTQLEEYNRCESHAASSVDGDDAGRRSKRGGIGKEPLNRSSEGHNGHSLVKVEDGGSLQLAFPECKELALFDHKPRNLSQKYRPKAFEEVVGQNIVTQALSNAILRGRIAPVYLFQGSRGTGKTTAARIFAAALICSSPEDRRPCGFCRECKNVGAGKCSEVREVDAASNNGIEKVKALLEETISSPALSRYKVFIVDECHVLTAETWNALLKILEEPPTNVVFILITTDPDRLPLTAVSRCQKFPFPKIKESEIVKRLQQLAEQEKFLVDPETLHLIASRSDGSLRDAETTLDQLSLLGQDVNPSIVYELVGSASDEQMLSLLDSALLADTVNTVRGARELVDSGVEPLSLMSRLATLITDIIAGSYNFTESQRKGFFKKQTLSEENLEWLRMAMKTLSEAEKQLRVSNDRATWLTAALLQLGPERPYMFPASCTGTSVTQSPVALDDVCENEAGEYEAIQSAQQTWYDGGNHGHNPEVALPKSEHCAEHITRHTVARHGSSWTMRTSHGISSVKANRKLSHGRAIHDQVSSHLGQTSDKQSYDEDLSDDFTEDVYSGQMVSSSKLDEIWCRVLDNCQLPLRELLHTHGKLLSVSMSEVDAAVHLEMSDPEHKAKSERSRKAIGNVFKSILGIPVEVKISLASLPAENEKDSNTRPSVKIYNQVQSSGGPSMAQKKKVKGYSLSIWKHAAHQPENSEGFPAIPQASFGSHMTDTGYMEKVRPEAKRLSPLPACMSQNMPQEDVGKKQSHDVLQGRDGYMRSMESEDMYSNFSDSEIHTETQSIDTLEGIASYERNRPAIGSADRHSGSHCIDGRTCDMIDQQKQKGSSRKIVHRFTMRSRSTSRPASNPESPDDQRSLQFAAKGHSTSQKSRDGQLSGDEVLEEAPGLVAIRKKSKIKGAAGSFARFFKPSK
ncbi:hypothetical protein KP509_27G034600 [Ceratopteris richardii]|uniref:DNA-directed DNA polymerase n=1 Tax=Ceratopteris richardii TaxID=49495 RepID=A0A8T2RH54_CERRI|nr:hypothetical protein KP509_27G034600 [Ceratopteris richardii]KAH7295143.1 hypothetical protein KP509_27G034600 [Ceratopteris richardii]KAH7295144.1 hypothetical protein KP509_27G034600 [Ceratopteris richardii]